MRTVRTQTPHPNLHRKKQAHLAGVRGYERAQVRWDLCHLDQQALVGLATIELRGPIETTID